jgi:1,5-anhydro-D-fructose reductase (1,5-anhydro-D-mannitol-forming)
MTLGWAMVGTGWHVRDRMAPAARRAANTRLAAVGSRDLARARGYAADFGFARAYDDYSELLADDEVDVVYLATPNHLHERQTIQAAQAGKHVLVEKPMALTSASAEAMVEACRSCGVKLGVGFHLRHHPAHVEIRRLLNAGVLGRPVVFRMEWVKVNPLRDGWWRDPEQVGAYISMARGVHLLDLICFLAGQQPLEVTAMTDGQREDRPLEETALAILRLPQDVFGTLVASRLFPHSQNSLAVYGSEGRALAYDTIGTDQGGSVEISTSHETHQMTYQACDPYQAEIEAFNRSISENLEPNASGVDGLIVVRITEALLESARTGRAVAVAAPRSA